MRWPVKKDQSDYLRERQTQNRASCLLSNAETWAAECLKMTGLKWTRQALWGCRLFDFWNAQKGIAVEIDGPEHNKTVDLARDKYVYERSGIVVLRVSNFDSARMNEAIEEINKSVLWKCRRDKLGLSTKTKAERRANLKRAGIKLAHGNWSP